MPSALRGFRHTMATPHGSTAQAWEPAAPAQFESEDALSLRRLADANNGVWDSRLTNKVEVFGSLVRFA